MTINEVRENFRYIDKLRGETARMRKEDKTLNDAVKELSLKSFSVFADFNPFFYGNPYNIHTTNIEAIWYQLESTSK